MSQPAVRFKTERVAFWMLALLTALIHWIPVYPPQIDLAQHAAQIRMLHEWRQPTFAFRELLELNFFTPYLPAILIGALLAWVLPATIVVKLLWSIGAFGLVFQTVRLRRLLGGQPAWDWLMLPGMLGTTFFWGFLTFQFAIPLGLVLLEWWIKFLDSPSQRKAIVLAVAFLLLFFCHALVCAWTLCVAGLMLLSRNELATMGLRATMIRVLPLLAPLPAVGLWMASTHHLKLASQPIIWPSFTHRVTTFFPHLLGSHGQLLTIAVGICLLLLPFLAGQRLSSNAQCRVPLLVTGAIVLVAPFRLFGTAIFYERFFVLLGPSLVIAMAGGVPVPSAFRSLRLVIPFITTFWIVLVTISMLKFRDEQAPFSRILAEMEPNKSVLSLITDAESEALGGYPAYLHFPVWYQVERGGLVEFNFAAFFPQIVRFRQSHSSAVPERFSGFPSGEGLNEHLARFDYVVLRAHKMDSTALDHLPVKLRAREAEWWLFENTAPDRSAP